MKDRLGLRLVIILALALICIYANMNLFVSGFEYSSTAKRLLFWQGEEDQRSLVLREGLDLQGGLRVLMRARGVDPTTEQMAQAVAVIQRRVDALGVTEPVVQTQGDDKIVVELPGVTDPDQAVRTIGRTALLEFIYSGTEPLLEGRKVSTSFDGTEDSLYNALPADKQKPFQGPMPTEEVSAAAAATSTVRAPTTVAATASSAISATAPTSTTLAAGATTGITDTESISSTAATTTTLGATATPPVTATGQTTTTMTTIYPTILTGKNILDPQVAIDSLTNQTVVSFSLDGDGSTWLGDFGAVHAGQNPLEVMPILLDKEVISSPTLNERITTSGQISGNFDQASAESLVAQLRSGSLPVPLEVVGQTQIGPTLGKQAIDAAVMGGLVGLAVVMVFMLLYYRLPGFLADAALILYALFSLTVFRAFPVTLTLAGIAGFVLSIGMAVDANILIFERMKEELRSGRPLRAAMDSGFSRAWPSIRDSNTSTLITCFILFWFGNQFGASIVKGFAITLSIGVLISMFTAIFVTRTFLLATQRYMFEDATAATTASSRLKALFGY